MLLDGTGVENILFKTITQINSIILSLSYFRGEYGLQQYSEVKTVSRVIPAGSSLLLTSTDFNTMKERKMLHSCAILTTC